MSEKGGQNLQAQLDELYEKQFWEPCNTKEQLRYWIETYLGIKLPNKVVSENSNSCPVDFVWDVYHAALTGNPNKTSFVVAASRNSMKTLTSAILEFLMMVHFGRDIVHQAAILDQSLACIDYLDKFLMNPIIEKHFKSDSKRLKQLEKMPLNRHKKIGYAKLKVIVSTKKSANAQRASVLVFDELDLIDKDILSESTFIADPDRMGKPPIFIYLSSRKSSVGPIQEKIDMSENPDSGVTLHKWNIVEFTQKCPPQRHKPKRPKVPMFIHKDLLTVKNQDQYMNMPTNIQAAYEKVDAFEGCLKCPIFIACRTESTKQTGDSPALRDIPFISTIIRDTADPEKINAQLLNLKPESGGVVFNKFSRELHKKSLEDVWEFAFHMKYDDKTVLTKDILIAELRRHGWKMNCGLDFGWVDPAAAILVAYQKSSDSLIVLHAELSPGFSNQDWVKYTKNKIYDSWGFDLLCPDTADKSIPSFAGGIGVPCRDRKPARIESGVSWLRTRLWNASTNSSQFVILEDENNPAVESLMKSLESWQYLKTPNGYDFSQFADDEWTHPLDAMRYAIDPFLTNNTAVLAMEQRDNSPKRAENTGFETTDSMKKMIKEHYWEEFHVDASDETDQKETQTSGGVLFTF